MWIPSSLPSALAHPFKNGRYVAVLLEHCMMYDYSRWNSSQLSTIK